MVKLSSISGLDLIRGTISVGSTVIINKHNKNHLLDHVTRWGFTISWNYNLVPIMPPNLCFRKQLEAVIPEQEMQPHLPATIQGSTAVTEQATN